MKDFARPPTSRERVAGILANAVLLGLFGSVSLLLASRSAWLGAAVCGALAGGALVMLYRAAFGARRGLNPKETRGWAWVLTVLGVCCFAIGLLIDGSMTHRFMVLGGSVTFLSAGLAGVRSRGDDA